MSKDNMNLFLLFKQPSFCNAYTTAVDSLKPGFPKGGNCPPGGDYSNFLGGQKGGQKFKILAMNLN